MTQKELYEKELNEKELSEKELSEKELSELDAEKKIQALTLKVKELEQELEKKEQDIYKLFHWINQFLGDVTALSHSLSWNIGDKISTTAMRLMFKKPDATAMDHLNQLMMEISDWQPISNTRNWIMTQNQITSPKHYEKWVKNYDSAVNEALFKKRMASWTRRPLISIVLPVYNIAAELLTKTVQSVIAQLYQNWELCIVDDASSEPHVKEILQQFAEKEDRIKLSFRDTNGHIAAASNDALELVSGDYIAFLDHDDTLASTALFWVVHEILSCPEVQIIYTDEDKKSMDDVRCDPYFKPDFNRDLLLSQNYMTHFAVYDAALIKKIKGFRPGFDGAQDYDLVLRAVSQVEEKHIRHIPRVLYHWRKVPGSTALDKSQKSYALDAAQKAIADYLKTHHLDAQVLNTPADMGYSRVKYALPKEIPLVSIIIPTYNGYDILKQCIDSILNKSTYRQYEICIVNNKSDEPETLEYLQALSEKPGFKILDYPHRFNFSKMNNIAVQQVKGELICFLNNDIEVITPDWLEEMVSHLLRKDIGIVGARLWYPNNTLQHGGIILGIGGIAGHAFKGLANGSDSHQGRAYLTQNMSAVTGACMLTKKEDFLALGGFNEEYLQVAFNDVDYCLRMTTSGKKIVWTPYAELYHHESISRGYDNTPEKMSRLKKEKNYMFSKWRKQMDTDPFYNPNLSLQNENYEFAWPPRIKTIDV